MRTFASLLLAICLSAPVSAAVNLLSSGSARIDFGDLSALSGATGFTLAVTVNPSAVGSGRLVTQWGGGQSDQAWLLQALNSDEIGFVVSNGLGGYHGEQTTGLNMSTSTVYRIVITKAFNVAYPDAINIYVNGSNEATTSFVSTATITAMINSSSSVQVGFETAESQGGMDGNYSEIAIWTEVIPAYVREAYMAGRSPISYRTSNSVVYTPAFNTSNLLDLWNGLTVTNSSGTSAAHPAMYHPN